MGVVGELSIMKAATSPREIVNEGRIPAFTMRRFMRRSIGQGRGTNDPFEPAPADHLLLPFVVRRHPTEEQRGRDSNEEGNL